MGVGDAPYDSAPALKTLPRPVRAGGNPHHGRLTKETSAVVAFLLERGAAPSARANDGDTPYDLALAREEPNEEVARLLRG